jgi:hypothetical protein
MPVDTLADDAQPTLKAAADYLRSGQGDENAKRYHLQDLASLESRLSRDIEERSTRYTTELHTKEAGEIDAAWGQLNARPKYLRLNGEQKAQQQSYEDLRRINGGVTPKDISPVLYTIPLILVGVAEWYVNYATFASVFIPVFAIAGTLLVAAVFAWASHMHGTYLKQLSEILHPSVEYRNVLGRQIATVIATVLLIAALVTVVWLRYVAITDQLGIRSGGGVPGTFGGPTTSMIWSRLGPTIVLNLIIWGIGMLYAWAMSEKVPGLREAYQSLSTTNKRLDRLRKPVESGEKRIRARYDREREKNQLAIKEYSNVLDTVRGLAERTRVH